MVESVDSSIGKTHKHIIIICLNEHSTLTLIRTNKAIEIKKSKRVKKRASIFSFLQAT